MLMLVMERNLWNRPRLVLGHGNSPLAATWSRWFRRHGWEVHLAATAEETYDLVHRLEPTAVILDIDLPDESGWLACAKLTLTHNDRRVYLIGNQPTARHHAFAAFAGAAGLFHKENGLQELLDVIDGELVQVG